MTAMPFTSSFTDASVPSFSPTNKAIRKCTFFLRIAHGVFFNIHIQIARSFSKGEYVQGSSVGDLEVLTDVPYAATVHAVRDTELGKIPKVLFYALARRYPQVIRFDIQTHNKV